MLLVNDLAGLGSEKDTLLPFNAAGSDVNSDIPFVMLTREFADRLLAGAGEPSLAELEKQIDKDLKPRSRELKGWTLTEKIAIERHGIDTKNVVGVLEGAGPHADETVVIGGHYDHLGHGGFTSGSLAIFSQRDPQRGRRQRLGNRHGARARTPAGRSPRPAARGGSSSSRSREKSAGCWARNTTWRIRCSRCRRRS